MDKILINVTAPTIAESFDIFVPVDLEIAMLAQVIADGIKDLGVGRYVPSGKELLMLVEPDMLLNPHMTLRDYGIHTGDRLVIL